MATHRNIPDLISCYATCYRDFEQAQEQCDSLQNGGGRDQKTGVIGEYYAYEYLKNKGDNPEYAPSGEHYDIIANGEKYQVKTVSYYSKTRTLSPIHVGWDYLTVVELNIEFIPEMFAIIPAHEFEESYPYNETKTKRGIRLIKGFRTFCQHHEVQYA